MSKVKQEYKAGKAYEKGRKYVDEHDWPNAVKHLLVAWETYPKNLSVLTLLAHALVQLGVREKAIEVLEKILEHHGPDSNVCAIMLQMALNMGMYDIGVKIGNLLISMDPENPSHYVNLATAYQNNGQIQEAIEFLQGVIQMFPEHSDLWNILGTSVRLRDGAADSLIFFEESLRLDPRSYKALSNYAHALLLIGDVDGAMKADLRAVEVDENASEAHIGLGMMLLYSGRLAEAWDHYKYRNASGRTIDQSQIYTHGLPEWQGESLEGKGLFIAAEQGIGDEIMWGNFLPFLYDRAEKLFIGCDRRLVSIYQRRFPNAFVEAYRDGIREGYRYRVFPEAERRIKAGELKMDFSIMLASAARYDWSGKDDVCCHPDGFCFADPELSATYKMRLDSYSKKPKIALAWRSGKMTRERSYLYATPEDMKPLMALADKVDFVNLQYGDCSEELKSIKALYGVDVINFEDVDLKQDIEANMAIVDNCDLVLSVCSAPGMFSMAAGVKTIIMSPDRPWWSFGSDQKVLFARDAEMVHVEKDKGWPEIMDVVVRKVKGELGL